MTGGGRNGGFSAVNVTARVVNIIIIIVIAMIIIVIIVGGGFIVVNFVVGNSECCNSWVQVASTDSTLVFLRPVVSSTTRLDLGSLIAAIDIGVDWRRLVGRPWLKPTLIGYGCC